MLACCVASLLLPQVAGAVGAAASCPPQTDLATPTEQLRSLSLDLLGTPPTLQDYAAVQQKGEVDAATLAGMLTSEAFADRAVRRHRDMLWIGLDNLRLLSVPQGLAKSGALYWRSGGNVAFYHRGNRVPCVDKPAEWDDDGEIVFWPQADGTKREGFVEVKPYWAPKTTIKVCALDAQATLVSPAGKDCSQQGSYYDAACGCGPELRWCRYGSVTDRMVLRGFATALEKQIAAVVAEDRPYTDLFTEKVAWVNGPIAYFWKHQAHLTAPLRMTPAPIDANALPNLPFDDEDTWVKVPLTGSHAGILTAPAFLLRFQTNRSRAARYYNTFLCQPFQAPETGIPVDAVAAVSEPDLQKRAGCKYCHALLEPVSAFWGRWVQNGAAFLDPAAFPPWRQDCDACAKTGQQCSTECKLHYMTTAYSEPEKAFLGWLQAYVFRQPAHLKHIDQGPKLMALGTVVDQRLPRCVVHSTAGWLLGRPLAGEDELAWADQLAIDFAQQGFSYRKLVATIVGSETYRRVR